MVHRNMNAVKSFQGNAWAYRQPSERKSKCTAIQPSPPPPSSRFSGARLSPRASASRSTARNWTDPAYVASLHAEIEQAAIKECKADLAGSVFYRYQIEDCIAGTVAAAVDEIGSEALSSYSASGERDYPIAG